jgi:serine protease AprX
VDTGTDGTHPMFQPGGASRVKKNIKIVCHQVLPVLIGDATPYEQCAVDATAVNDTDTPSAGGHGTLVTGIASGGRVVDRAGRHLRGAAPGADIVSVSMAAAVNTYGGSIGMYWVLDHHADPCGDGSCAPIVAVNNSWGITGAFDPTAPQVLIGRQLVAEGVTVVWAAGNSGGNGSANTVNPYSVDPTPGVLSVANYDDADTGTRDNDLAPGSSRGLASDRSTYPDLSGPGTRITSACRADLAICAAGGDTGDPDYNTLTGTSMAAPHVAGYVAVLQQAALKTTGRRLSPGAVEDLLLDTAYKFGSRTWLTDTRNPDSTTGTSFDAGHGLVDVTAALGKLTGRSLAVPPPTCPADARFTDPEGDAVGVYGAPTPLPNEPGLDLTAGWLTTGATGDVTFHWTVADLPTTPGGTEADGESFDFGFTVGGGAYILRAERTQTRGQTFELLTASSQRLATGLSGSFDPATDKVTVTLPAGLIDGNEISDLAIESARELLSSITDEADGRSCAYAVG